MNPTDAPVPPPGLFVLRVRWPCPLVVVVPYHPESEGRRLAILRANGLHLPARVNTAWDARGRPA